MKNVTLLCVLLISHLSAQQLSTSTGHILFRSESPLEEITANNNQVRAALNLQNGQAAAVVQIRGFKFAKALMEEHFNDNYMESHKFPRATFSGTLESAEKLKTPGSYTLNLSGDLEIHGKTNALSQTVPLTVENDGTIRLVFSFDVNLADFGIKNDKPRYIANTIQINVNFKLSPA
jgi:polyisoprenoid-binding protein YceI